jgi:hypothetical protein
MNVISQDYGSKAATYSECFETDEDTGTKHSKQKSKASRSSMEAKKNHERTSQAESERRRDEPPLSQDEHMSSPDQQNDFILPVMASTMVSGLNHHDSVSVPCC